MKQSTPLLLVILLITGCVIREDHGIEDEPLDVETEIARVEGAFVIIGQVSANGENRYTTDGERSLEAPPGTTSINVTISWSSPADAEFAFALGQEGAFITEEVSGSSPVSLHVEGEFREEPITILVRPIGPAGVNPYQSFDWDAILVVRKSA